MSAGSASPPRIAVCLATYNGSRFLERQLASIAEQTDLPELLVVSDDASTDPTLELVDEFARTAPFPVEVITHPRNVGVHRNFDDGLRTAAGHGEIVVLCDQDDLWSAEKVARVRADFAARPTATLWFSDAEVIDADDEPTGVSLWDWAHLTPSFVSSLTAGGGLDRLLYGSTITGAVMAVRSDVIRLGLPIPRDGDAQGHPLYLHDGWLALVARVLGDVIPVPVPLTRYRRHDAQFTTKDWRIEGSRRDGLIRDHRRLELLASVLERHPDAGWDPGRRDETEARLRFLGIRSLPAGYPRRKRRVLRAWAAGSYGRFSSGARTALFDLVRAVR